MQREKGRGALTRILALAKEKHIPVSEAERAKLDALSQTGAHQGIIAYVAAAAYCSVADMLAEARDKGEAPLLVLCDSLNDAHNLGSILRTAHCCGAHGVIIPKHRSVGLSAVAAKASAGAVEYIKVAKVTNLARCIDELKREGLWVCGTDAAGEQEPLPRGFDRPARHCDWLRGRGHEPARTREVRLSGADSHEGQNQQPKRLRRGGRPAL